MVRIANVFPLTVIGALAIVGCVGAEPGPDDGLGDEISDGDQDVDGVGEAEQDLNAYCNDILTWDSTWANFESQVITLVNQKRAAGATCGTTYYSPKPALAFDDRLRCSSRKHSKDMGVNNFFSHTGSNGSQPWDRMTSAGYVWTSAAENIGAGYTTPTAVVDGWMASPGHCTNIMSATSKHIGVGYYYAGTSTYKHYWTENFGSQ
jgi:uncharacterized protein YkwD